MATATERKTTVCGASAIGAYLAASLAILRFYAHVVFRFGEIHPDLPSGKLMSQLVSLPPKQVNEASRVRLRAAFARDFDERYEKLQTFLRESLAPTGAAEVPFETTMMLSFAVRVGWAAIIAFVVIAAGDADGLSALARVCLLLIGLLQFVVAPLSLPVCILRLGTNVWDCALHYALNLAAAGVVRAITGGAGSGVALRFGWPFLGMFLALDFVLNVAVHMRLSEPFGAARLLRHMAYGTLNTKTYFAVVVGVLAYLEVDLAVVVLTGVFAYLACVRCPRGRPCVCVGVWLCGWVGGCVRACVRASAATVSGAPGMRHRRTAGSIPAATHSLSPVFCARSCDHTDGCRSTKGVLERLLTAAGLPGFAVMFYCEHRINHCPVVYVLVCRAASLPCCRVAVLPARPPLTAHPRHSSSSLSLASRMCECGGGEALPRAQTTISLVCPVSLCPHTQPNPSLLAPSFLPLRVVV
jgi:hypothetical protein